MNTTAGGGRQDGEIHEESMVIFIGRHNGSAVRAA